MAVPEGLLVPVVRRADEKDLLAVAKEIRSLATRSRDGDLSVDDMAGASFTITSLASYDIDAFTPIIDPPQVAILGVGRIAEKPAVHEGEVAVRSMMFLSLAFDHRALDGRDGEGHPVGSQQVGQGRQGQVPHFVQQRRVGPGAEWARREAG